MPSDVQHQTASVNARFVEAFKQGDAGAIASLYTPGAQLLPPHSDFVSGTAAIREFWQGVIQLGIKEVSLETIELEEHGDTAIEVGRYRLFLAGGQVADQGKYLVVWKNTGGSWKLHRDIWTSSQPAPVSA